MKKLIRISLLVLVLFFFVCSVSAESNKEDELRALVTVAKEKKISQIIEEAKTIVSLKPKNNNIVFIVGKILRNETIKIIKNINDIEHDSQFSEIVIYLDSEGGKVDSGLAICRTIANCQKNVKIISRCAMSIAADILAVGTKGQRFVIESNDDVVMIHHTYYAVSYIVFLPSVRIKRRILLASELTNSQAMTLIIADESTRGILVENTKLSKEQIVDAVNKTTFYTAEEAVKFGFADKVVSYKLLFKIFFEGIPYLGAFFK